MDTEKLIERYGKSEKGNFFIADSIGVPHPYCISSRHVAEASDHHGGMLNEAAIEAAEKKGIYCHTCRGQLKFHQHEKALLVSCKAEVKGEDGKAVPELHDYLLACKEKAEADGFAGFAFVRA